MKRLRAVVCGLGVGAWAAGCRMGTAVASGWSKRHPILPGIPPS